MKLSTLILCVFGFAMIAILPAQVQAENLVRVELNSGTVWKAEFDSRSDDRTVWLRFASNSTTLLKRFPRDQIASINVIKPSASKSRIATPTSFAEIARRALFEPVVASAKQAKKN